MTKPGVRLTALREKGKLQMGRHCGTGMPLHVCYKSHMDSVGIRELRQHASELQRRVEAGETIEITQRGRPVALLGPLASRGVRARRGKDAVVVAVDEYQRLTGGAPDFKALLLSAPDLSQLDLDSEVRDLPRETDL